MKDKNTVALVVDSNVYRRLLERGLLSEARTVAERHHVTLGELLGRSKTRKVCEARRDLFLALWSKGFSQCEIGRLLERHPSTIHQAVDATVWTAAAPGSNSAAE